MEQEPTPRNTLRADMRRRNTATDTRASLTAQRTVRIAASSITERNYNMSITRAHVRAIIIDKLRPKAANIATNTQRNMIQYRYTENRKGIINMNKETRQLLKDTTLILITIVALTITASSILWIAQNN